MEKIDQFAEKAIKKLKETITDEVFLIIQNDKELMQEYLRQVHEKGVEAVNRRIGRLVKTEFNLSNDVVRNDSPKSTLIKSFQIFE